MLWKTAFRKFWHNGHLFVTLLNGLALCFMGYIYFSLGTLWKLLLPFSLASVPEALKGPFFIVIIFLILDLVGKYFFRQVDFSFLTFKRFPGINKSLNVIYLLKEGVSFWNIYIVLILAKYLYDSLYLNVGTLPFITSLFISIGLQIIVSLTATRLQFALHIKACLPIILLLLFSTALYWTFGMTSRLLYVLFVSVFITIYYLLSKNLYLVNYSASQGANQAKSNERFKPQANAYYFVRFNFKMLWRSPFLRKQLIMVVILSALYFHLFLNGSMANSGSAVFRLCAISFIFSIYAMLFSPYLISTESSFFPKLMLIPKFDQYFLPKYALYMLFSSLSFIAFSIATGFKSMFELTALFLYCTGPIALGSFCSILYADKPINLGAGAFNRTEIGFTAQSWMVLLTYLICLLFAIGAYYMAPQTDFYLYFMTLTGIVSILFAKKWLLLLLRLFYKTKYKKQIAFQK